MSHEIVTCPSCGCKAFSLLRGKAGAVFGVTCRECNHSFNLDQDFDNGDATDECDDDAVPTWGAVKKLADHVVEADTRIDDRMEAIEERLDRVERDIDVIDGGY